MITDANLQHLLCGCMRQTAMFAGFGIGTGLFWAAIYLHPEIFQHRYRNLQDQDQGRILSVGPRPVL